MKPLGSTIVIRPGALGDAVLTLPALLQLSRAGARPLNVFGTPASWAFLRPDVEGLRIFDFSSSAWLGLFADGANISTEARALFSSAELAVVYLADESNAVKLRLEAFGVKRVIIAKPPTATYETRFDDLEHTKTSQLKPSFLPTEHTARRLLTAIDDVVFPNLHGKVLSPEKLDEAGWLTPTNEEQSSARALLKQLRTQYGVNDFIAIHPGSGGRRKCWESKHFATLAARAYRELGLMPLVFFGLADVEAQIYFEISINELNAKYHVFELLPLREVFAILKECRAFVGNDAGITHLAARATKTLAIFGPTDFFEWGPVGSSVRVIQAPFGDLKKLSNDSVFDAVKSL